MPLYICHFSTRGSQFASGSCGIDFRHHARFELLLDDVQTHVAQGHKFGVEGTKLKVVRGNVSRQREQDVVIVRSTGIGFSFSGLDGTSDAPPDIKFITEIKRQAIAVDLSSWYIDGNWRRLIPRGEFALGISFERQIRNVSD